MAWRGRGRGRGGFGQSRFAKEEPFILFPENVVLPEPLPMPEMEPLISRKLKLENYFECSPYMIEDKGLKSKSEAGDTENKNKQEVAFKRGSISDFIKHNPKYIPHELLEGTNLGRHTQKKLRWDPESGLQKLDKLEELEGKYKGGGKSDDKEKKEDGEENEEVGTDEEQEDESDDGDYNQNFDFDDDEDDLNMEDDDDGPAYDD